MAELPAILEVYNTASTGERMALATVVKVQGSAYRRPGARMLITSEGRTVGAISGGCLESDVVEHAKRVLVSGQAIVITYDGAAEEDNVYGLGMGCNGVTSVLIEPVQAGKREGPLAFLAECQARRQAGVLATVIQSEGDGLPSIGMRLMLDSEGRLTGETECEDLVRALLAEMQQVFCRRRSTTQEMKLGSGTAELFFEFVPPPVSLMIFGAGYDALPLASLAKQLGWQVTVVDHRPAYATPDRFPAADAVVCTHPGPLPESVVMNSETVAMLMTHHYLHDKEWLRTLLPLPLRYLGILGPRARTERLLGELQAEGVAWDLSSLQRLYYPAGVDIGAETPEEIALAILAEMRAVLAGRSGGLLKTHTGPIHPDR
ncbi:MAG TPA: XdhC family protein [Chthonomonadaceae bacterium]|nr:XdhC family protein [Chthonomonadaceae bacterium]